MQTVVALVATMALLACLPQHAAAGSSSGWMARAEVQNKTLQQITLPGTHDSGAYWLSKDLDPGMPYLDVLIEFAESIGLPIEDIITPWALSQNTSFYQQMVGGIRYVDLRSAWNGTVWRTFHFELGNPVQVLLSDIQKFLVAFPTEVVVVEISHLDGNPPASAKAKLVSMVETTLQGLLYPSTNGFADTIGGMVAKGQRAVVSLDDQDAIVGHPLIWPGSTMHNSYANSDNVTTMIAYNNDRVVEYNSNTWPNQLYKISWTLTPQVGTILRMFEKGQPKSLQQLAVIGNKQLDAFVKAHQGPKQMLGNLFLIDWWELSNIISLLGLQG